MTKKSWVRNVLLVLGVAGAGFVVLNLLFVLDAAFQSLLDLIFRVFTPVDINMAWSWYPAVKAILFVIIIAFVSWPIFRSKLATVWKAIYLFAPTALGLFIIAVPLYRWPPVAISLGTIATLITLYCFYKTKQPWLYYYSVIIVALALLIITLTGTQI